MDPSLLSQLATSAAILAAVAAAVTAGAVLFQTRGLQFSAKVQALARLEERFNEPAWRRLRHLAAQQLLNNAPEGEVDEVLGFLDTIALLVRRGALDVEMVWHTFFYWIYGYWNAAASVITRERNKNPRVWEDLPTLYEKVLSIENQKGTQRQASGEFYGPDLEDRLGSRLQTQLKEALDSLDDVIWSAMWTCSACGRETVVGYTGKPWTVVSDDAKAAMMRKAENDHRPGCSGRREVEPWRRPV